MLFFEARVTVTIRITLVSYSHVNVGSGQDETSDTEGKLQFEILISLRSSLTPSKDVSVSRCIVKKPPALCQLVAFNCSRNQLRV